MPPVFIETDSQLQALLASGKLVIIDFFATWCGPCKAIAPHFDRAAQVYPPEQVVFCKVDVDRCQEIAARFNVTAMPTFVLWYDGAVVATHKGANLDAVLASADQQLRMMPPKSSQGRGTDAATSLSSSSVAGGVEQRESSASKILALLSSAEETANGGPAQDSSAAEAFHLVEQQLPLGVALVPLLLSRHFRPTHFGRLLRWAKARPPPADADASAIVFTLHSFITSSLSWQTWGEAAGSSSMGDSGLNAIGELKHAYMTLLTCPEAQAVILPTSRFVPLATATGKDLELGSSLGPIFGINFVPMRSVLMIVHREKMKLFPSLSGGELDSGRAEESTSMMHRHIARAVEENFAIVRELLKPSTRQRTLEWMAAVIEKNVDYGKEMQREEQNLSNLVFMIVFANVCVQLALPVIGAASFPGNIPPQYVYDSKALVPMSNGGDIERVGSIEAEDFPPIDPEVANYKPVSHLFFLAIRSLSLSYIALLTKIKLYEGRVRHPAIHSDEKAVLPSLIGFNRALLTVPTLVTDVARFMNAVAAWLLAQLNVSPRGTLPAMPPLSWQVLPQQIIEDVVRSTQILTLLRVDVDPVFMSDIVGLVLVLMGNSVFLPKPHTHALFPELLISMFNKPSFLAMVQNHSWFPANIVKNCINCYVLMEKCVYERVETRYYLSLILVEIMKHPSLCDPVRELFDRRSNSTELPGEATAAGPAAADSGNNAVNTLERFASMVTSETNSCLDEALASLSKMREKEIANGNAAPADDDYAAEGRGLEQALRLVSSSIALFQSLTERFPHGVQDKMVQQQIASMLIRSIVKLAGPNSRELKLVDPLRYGFEPRKMLHQLVDCSTFFRSSMTFATAVCETGVAIEDVHFAIDNICGRPLVTPFLAAELQVIQQNIRTAHEAAKISDEVWADAPEEFLCALLSTPLSDIVAMPTTAEDLTFVNRESIEHQLLKQEIDPFTRAELTIKQLNEFNARPDVQQKIQARKAEMKDWLASKGQK